MWRNFLIFNMDHAGLEETTLTSFLLQAIREALGKINSWRCSSFGQANLHDLASSPGSKKISEL
jgi:hypothetical protein